jgi:hypothetical protein
VTATVARGVTSNRTGLEDFGVAALSKPFRDPWDQLGPDRDDAIDAFIEGMPAKNRSISLLHIALPHVGWEYMPDGSIYSPEPDDGYIRRMPSERSDADHFLQQMLLQLSFTDHKLSQIVDRMKAEGTWDKSLFVVTADHGASFAPDSSRRYLTDENLGWMLPVPLFIKYPGQKTAKMVRGPVDSRDITPTIFDVLGGEAAHDADGRSLLGKVSLPPKGRLEIESYNRSKEPHWDQIERRLRQARRQKNVTFGGGELFALGGNRNLIGRTVDQVVGLKPIEATLTDQASYGDVEPSDETLPSLLSAELSPAKEKPPGDLAVVVNKRIVATAKAWPSGTGWETALNLPNRAFRPGGNRVEFYSIPAN